MDDGEVAEFPGFSYNITEVAFSGMAEITPKSTAEELKERLGTKHNKLKIRKAKD